MRKVWTSTKMLAKAGTGVLKLTLASISAVIYMKRSAGKAEASFRKALAQQGLPDETVDTLTSAYGAQLKKLSSISDWIKQLRG